MLRPKGPGSALVGPGFVYGARFAFKKAALFFRARQIIKSVVLGAKLFSEALGFHFKVFGETAAVVDV